MKGVYYYSKVEILGGSDCVKTDTFNTPEEAVEAGKKLYEDFVATLAPGTEKRICVTTLSGSNQAHEKIYDSNIYVVKI